MKIDDEFNHIHITGLSIKLVSCTMKGWKTLETNTYPRYTRKKTRTVTRFYSDVEIIELFKKKPNV
jgi:hypothetical protein